MIVIMFKLGDYKAVCDLCGLDFYASQLMQDPWGRRVDKKCFETRHPQEFVRGKPEKISPDWSRPAEVLGQADKGDADSGGTITWSSYPQHMVLVEAVAGAVNLTVGLPGTSVKIGERVTVTRIGSDSGSFAVNLTATGAPAVSLTGHQSAIYIADSPTVWRLFGVIGT